MKDLRRWLIANDEPKEVKDLRRWLSVIQADATEAEKTATSKAESPPEIAATKKSFMASGFTLIIKAA